ncbi:hypothetical protein [Streptomyces sp. NPDC003635]
MSGRSKLILAVLVAGVLVLAYSATTSDRRTFREGRLSAGPLQDRPLAGGGTAQLSKCGVDDGPRPVARGEGERGQVPRLLLSSWGFYDPGSKTPGQARFTVHVAIRSGDRPLYLDAPVAKGKVTLDFYGPHGEGRRASARGLTATVVDGGFMGKPVKVPETGSFRVDPGRELLLDVDLPAKAVCPGHSLLSLNKCLPENTNDVEDCPVLVVTLADPAIRAYRAKVADVDSADSFSDRLVAVSFERATAQISAVDKS